MVVEHQLRSVDLQARAAEDRWTRSFGLVDPTSFPDPYLGLAGTPPLYRLVTPDDPDKRPYRERSPNKKQHYRDAPFMDEKGPSELRVFAIGGSSVRSDAFMEPDGSFSWMLQRYLNGAMRGPDERRRFARVINAGGGGMGSLQNLEVLREVLDYSPDLLVVYPEGGEKNFIGDSPQAVLAKADDGSPARPAVRRALAGLRLYQMVRDAFRWVQDDAYARYMPLPDSESNAIPSAFSAISLSIVAKDFSPQTFTRIFEMKRDRVPPLMEGLISNQEIEIAHDRFRRNLRSMASLARDAGVPLLFVVPVRNLKQSFYLRFHITPEEIRDGCVDAWREAYARGCAAKREGRYREALAAFQRVREQYLDDQDEILAFYMAECHEALGDAAAALREYSLPYLRHPMRAQILEVAEDEGVPVLDPFPALLAAAGGVAPGYEWFTDSFHPMPNTNQVLAREILSAALRQGWVVEPNALDSRPMENAEREVSDRVAQCRPPDHNRMLLAIESGQYDVAIRIAEELGGKLLAERVIEPLYYGWALTRNGELDRARTFFKQLREQIWRPGLQALPPLDTDEDVVRIAFEGDIFHYF